jgi:REP element-mobilizing transposase RayT
MARRPREFVEGIYHVACQASDTRFLFVDDTDREIFLDALATTCDRYELGLVTYTLMGNHYHSVVAITGPRFSYAMQRLHTWYSRRHNKRHQREAHLFRAHFFARLLTSDEDLLWACRYVARNPVEAGLAAHPLAWPWSGARANAGVERPRIPLDDEPLRAALGGSLRWRVRYADFLETADERAAKTCQPG